MINVCFNDFFVLLCIQKYQSNRIILDALRGIYIFTDFLKINSVIKEFR